MIKNDQNIISPMDCPKIFLPNGRVRSLQRLLRPPGGNPAAGPTRVGPGHQRPGGKVEPWKNGDFLEVYGDSTGISCDSSEMFMEF